MKTRIPALRLAQGLGTALLLLAFTPAFAQQSFPGLKTLLSATEWQRAGLDRLTPDQLGVIDAALIRREAGLSAQHQAEVATASQAAAAPAGQPAPGPATGFGLKADNSSGWESIPPLKARVVKWETPNRFLLDNKQAWESTEPIVFDLVGQDIEIQARPNDRFTLVVGGVNTTLRVRRVR